MADKRRLSAKEAKLKARKRDNQFKFIIVGVIAALVLVAMIFNFFNIDLINVSGDKETFTAKGSNGSFPYSVDNSSDLTVLSSTKDNLLYLNNNNLHFVNPSNGENVKTINHFYSNPVIDSNGKYVITYDQGRNKLRIDSSTNVIYDSSIEQNIITATVGESGCYAVATTSKTATSEIKFYSRSLKELFTWYSTDSYIIDIAISDNGKFSAVATVNSKATVVNSSVYIFDNKTGKQLSKFNYNDSTVADLQYAGDSLFVISKDFVDLILDCKTQKNIVKQHSANVISYFVSTANELKLITSEFINSNECSLIVVNRKGELKKQLKLSGKAINITGSSNATCVLFNDKIEYYNSAYELKNTLKTKENVHNIRYFSSNIYQLTNLYITKNQLKAG